MTETYTWDVEIGTTQPTDLCAYIVNLGGWTAVSTADVIYIMECRLGLQNPGFTVDTNSVLGTMYYRLGQKDLGNQTTGCNFP